MAKKKNDKDIIKKNNTKANNLRSELKKVSWPSATELSKATTAVLFIVIFTAAIIFIADTIFSLGSKEFTKYVNKRNPETESVEVNEGETPDITVAPEGEENNEERPEEAEKTEEAEKPENAEADAEEKAPENEEKPEENKAEENNADN